MNKDSFNSLLISSNDFAEISNLDYSNRVAYDKNLLKRYDLEIIEISENPNFHCKHIKERISTSVIIH